MRKIKQGGLVQPHTGRGVHGQPHSEPIRESIHAYDVLSVTNAISLQDCESDRLTVRVESNASRSMSTAAGASAPRRGRGRPPRGESGQVFQALLNAARQALDKDTYQNISVRDLATAAGGNAAMINYYFGGKEGLFLALIDCMFDDIVERLERLCAITAPEPSASVRALADVMMSIYTGWNPVLSLFSAGAALPSGMVRVAYQRRLACRVYEALRRYLDRLIAHGFCRSGLDSEVAAVLLGALLSSPFHFSPLMNVAGHLTWEAGHRPLWRDYFERTVRTVLL